MVVDTRIGEGGKEKKREKEKIPGIIRCNKIAKK